MADEKTAAWQILQGVAAFVATEGVGAVAGKTQVTEDHLGIEVDLRASQLTDAGRVGHQHTRVSGQHRRPGVREARALMTCFVNHDTARLGGQAADE
ncbi:hypothetical protein D3C81_2006650 [compost metagenome]